MPGTSASYGPDTPNFFAFEIDFTEELGQIMPAGTSIYVPTTINKNCVITKIIVIGEGMTDNPSTTGLIFYWPSNASPELLYLMTGDADNPNENIGLSNKSGIADLPLQIEAAGDPGDLIQFGKVKVNVFYTV